MQALYSTETETPADGVWGGYTGRWSMGAVRQPPKVRKSNLVRLIKRCGRF
jgi:hypothetical protein